MVRAINILPRGRLRNHLLDDMHLVTQDTFQLLAARLIVSHELEIPPLFAIFFLDDACSSIHVVNQGVELATCWVVRIKSTTVHSIFTTRSFQEIAAAADALEHSKPRELTRWNGTRIDVITPCPHAFHIRWRN